MPPLLPTPPQSCQKTPKSKQEIAAMTTNELHHPKRPSGVTGLLILTAILISAWASGCNQNAGQTIAFTHVNLIPMTSEKVIADQTVLVRGTEITAIGESGKLKIPWGAQVIDGKGTCLMQLAKGMLR
jgi:hypothetical protein